MWDLDGLINVNDLRLDYHDLETFINLFNIHLSDDVKFCRLRLLGQPLEFTTTEEIYNKIGLYSISFIYDLNNQLKQIHLTGNTDLFKYYSLLTYFLRKNVSSVYCVYLYFNILGVGKELSVLDSLFLVSMLKNNRLSLLDSSLDLSLFFNELLDSNIPYSGNPYILYTTLLKYNIHMNHFPQICLYKTYLMEDSQHTLYKTIFSLYQLSLTYDINISMLGIERFYSMKSLYLSFISFCPNVHLYLLSKNWNHLGIKDGESLYLDGVLIGYRKDLELVIASSSDLFEEYLKSDIYLSLVKGE